MSKPVEVLFPIESGLKDIGICPFCKKPINANDFRDELSRKEFRISGLCQKCQDEVFNEKY